jgi:hypothetical protein
MSLDICLTFLRKLVTEFFVYFDFYKSALCILLCLLQLVEHVCVCVDAAPPSLVPVCFPPGMMDQLDLDS